MELKDFIKIVQDIKYINFYAKQLSEDEQSKVVEKLSIEDRKTLSETLQKIREIIK